MTRSEEHNEQLISLLLQLEAQTAYQVARNERLLRLLPHIQSRANHYFFRYERYDLDPDDVVQEACLSFLERAESDPTFLDQSDQEIVHRCSFAGRGFCGRLAPHRMIGRTHSAWT